MPRISPLAVGRLRSSSKRNGAVSRRPCTLGAMAAPPDSNRVPQRRAFPDSRLHDDRLEPTKSTTRTPREHGGILGGPPRKPEATVSLNGQTLRGCSIGWPADQAVLESPS